MLLLLSFCLLSGGLVAASDQACYLSPTIDKKDFKIFIKTTVTFYLPDSDPTRFDSPHLTYRLRTLLRKRPQLSKVNHIKYYRVSIRRKEGEWVTSVPSTSQEAKKFYWCNKRLLQWSVELWSNLGKCRESLGDLSGTVWTIFRTADLKGRKFSWNLLQIQKSCYIPLFSRRLSKEG